MNASLKHITRLLSEEQVLAAYDRVAELYPHVPSLSLWRAWEFAAYAGRTLQQPVLDVGCGDGRWFQLVWPEITDVYGIDLEPAVVERAMKSGVYRKVWQADAAAMPVDAGMFGTVFANCSLEHMDSIHTVMSNVWRALCPGGLFIFSIVTDKINDWFSPATLARALGQDALAHNLYEEWLRYHHLVNPFPIESWCEGLIDAGFEVVEHIPIIPEMTGRLFLLIDGLWHKKQGAGEIGDQLHPYLRDVPNFPAAFRGILQSALLMESRPQIGCGAVLVAKKVERAGQMVEHPRRLCWCGDSQLNTFSADYLSCAACGTLVSQVKQNDDAFAVRDDSRDFYGKEYWLSHQRQDLGLPDIYTRARADLPERCLYWLRTFLSYKLPPARVLELGSSHGGFVALLRWAGFDAAGLELSPWIVDYAQRMFGIPMLQGPIEEQQQPAQSFDAIILNDVLEHLPDPLGTLQRCVDLLKPDGMMLIQTPSYPDPQTHKDLVRGEDRFIEMLEPGEHLYLFSQRAVRQLLERLGYGTLQFKPALFPYDMYMVASRHPLPQYIENQITASLLSTPSGHMVQALLDKAREIDHIHSQFAVAEADRAARLEVIERLHQQLQASEADRAARLEVIERLNEQLQASEADRAARLEVIERLKAQLDSVAGAADQYVLPARRIDRHWASVKYLLRRLAHTVLARFF